MEIIFFVSFVAILCGQSYSLTDEDVKANLVKNIMRCTKTHPVDMTELMKLQNLVVPKKPEVKCLLACAYRGTGMMNEKGFYDVKHAYEVAEKAKNGDEQRGVNGKKLVDLCSKVNQTEVTDGEKGCERAALMFKCITENAPKLGFKV